MRTSQWAIPLAAVFLAACGRQPVAPSAPPSLSAAESASIENGVRAFAQTMARDVTAEGPAAWGKHFAEGSAFFMAANGRLVFPDRASAKAGIQDLTRTLKGIELQWGDDLRVDPLAPNLAMLAASYHEVLISTGGGRW
jgi:hypothetical protein